MKPNELKELVATFRELSLSHEEFGKALSGVVDIAKPLKRLLGDPNAEAKAKGSRLIAAGMALIAFPDPTISDLIGAALIAAGLIRTGQITVADVYREFQGGFRKVENITQELTY
ncbi:MAG: hypothetical protein OEX10_05400 [Candidatus Bathyarchaeota archaeon]|nr:hypothetical protein [Candidatus Bathyarchaeota archaeon]MDH5664075.1 hypothetical protein [Candidatus Bathyarchaeota archaeon]